MVSRSRAFLESHPELADARARSSVWPRILRETAIEVGGETLFLVAGDTLGDDDDLYLERLARGARAAGSDPTSRELFLELPQHLHPIVYAELLQQRGS